NVPPTAQPSSVPTNTPAPIHTATPRPAPTNTPAASCNTAGPVPQSLTVVGTASGFVSTSFVTDPAVSYRITVTGNISYWSGNAGYQTDPNYVTYDSWVHHQIEPLPKFQYQYLTTPVPDDPNYDTTQTYSFTRQGNCQKFGFRL